MARDMALLPKQALRLCALGTLLEDGPRRYAELAAEIRDFTAYLIGPSPALAGMSLELLRYDGLVDAVGGSGMTDNAVLGITDTGKGTFVDLMSAPLGATEPGLMRLFVTLKVRFAHLLDEPRRREQIAALVALHQKEHDRLVELRQRHRWARGSLPGWLDHEVDQTERTVRWFEALAGGSERS